MGRLLILIEKEWTESNERVLLIQRLHDAIHADATPKDLKKNLKDIQSTLAGMKFWKNWPIIDKGYYEDAYPLIQKSARFLRKTGLRRSSEKENIGTLSDLAYRTLNHVHRFDVQTKSSPRWLFETLEDKAVQRSIYIHVLSRQTTAHHEVAHMKLIEDFDLFSRLDKSMQEFLLKRCVFLPPIFDRGAV